MKLSVIIVITSLLIFYHLGIFNLFCLIISLISFLYGYIFFDPISLPYFMENYKCEISKGIPKIVNDMKDRDKPPLDTKITSSPNLDKALVDITDLVLRDYIEVWYKHISSSKEFSYEVRQAIYKVLGNFCQRCKNVDWISVITENLPNEIGSHIRLYRLSNQNCRRNKDKNLYDEFFSLESEIEKEFCRQKICMNLDAEKDYLRSISEFILYIITSSEEFNVPPLRHLLRETLVNAILLPTLNLVSDPDFINQYIVWMCKDNSYTTEYFIQSIKMSECPDEMTAVIEKLEFFTNRLRSRDSGGEDDAIIKAQIGSLDFTTRICNSRLKKLEESKNKDDYPSVPKSISMKKIISLTPEMILEHQIGISLFNEYLTTVNLQNYMTIYLDIIQFQSTFNKLTDNSKDVFLFKDDEKFTNSSEFSPISISEQLRYCSKILQDVRNLNISEKLLTDVEAKINSEEINENVFNDIMKEIIDVMKEKKLFDSFKMSTYGRQFMEEIDYCLDSMISEEDLIDENLLIAEDLSGPSVSQQQCNENDTYTVRIVDAGMINKNSFVVYTLAIIKKNKYGEKDTWKIERRYRDFDALNNSIINVCGKIPSLKLPAKKPFNNVTNDFLEKRSSELQDYLKECLEPKTLQDHPAIRQPVVQFLQKNNPDPRIQANKIQSIVNPFKSVKNSVLSMPDNLVGNITKLYSSISPTKKLTSQTSLITSLLSNDPNDHLKFGDDNDQTKAENIPIRILFLLFDEIFDLQNKSQVVRRGIISILRRIVKTFFGDKYNNIILEKAARSTSADQIAELVVKLKDSMWPNGKLATASNGRDKMTKMRTRVLCRTKMLGSISDEVSQLLGNETSRQGVQRVFNLCQDQILNKRLAHSILQMVLQKIFVGHNLENLMHYKLCPAANGKACDKHKLVAPEWRDWGCLQPNPVNVIKG